MNHPLVFFVLLGAFFLWALLVNILVWFKYQKYEQWARSVYSTAEKENLPFATFFKSFISLSASKWLARIVALFALFISMLPFLALFLFS